jgi:hypothetical protein
VCDAIARQIREGGTLAIEGFSAYVRFVAADKAIHQALGELTMSRVAPYLISDHMSGAGCGRRVGFSSLGNPAIGSLHPIRRTVEKGMPRCWNPSETSTLGWWGIGWYGLGPRPPSPCAPSRGATCLGLPKTEGWIGSGKHRDGRRRRRDCACCEKYRTREGSTGARGDSEDSEAH